MEKSARPLCTYPNLSGTNAIRGATIMRRWPMQQLLGSLPGICKAEILTRNDSLQGLAKDFCW